MCSSLKNARVNAAASICWFCFVIDFIWHIWESNLPNNGTVIGSVFLVGLSVLIHLAPFSANFNVSGWI